MRNLKRWILLALSVTILSFIILLSCGPGLQRLDLSSGSSPSTSPSSTPPTAAKVAFLTQPSASVKANVTLSEQPVVGVQDSSGNLFTSATHSITLSAYKDSTCTTAAGGVLSGTTTAAASAGKASFSGLSYDKGSNLYLKASTDGLTAACSSQIRVNSYPFHIFSDDPVGYWRLGETSGTTATDFSGNSLNGTYNNLPTLGVLGAIPGNSDNRATALNGTSQSIQVSNNSLLNPTQVSVEAWIKTTATSGAIVAKFGSLPNAQYKLDLSSGNILFAIRGPTGSACDGTTQSATTGAAYNDNAWHHVVGTYDGSNLKIYVDGSLSNSTAYGLGLCVPSSPPDLGIGATYNGASVNGFYYAGIVDEVAIYPYALTLTQISNHYNAGKFDTFP